MADALPRLPSRPLRWSDAVFELRDLLADTTEPTYFVGGVVRDALLSRPTQDIDLVTAGSGLTLAKLIANRMKGDYFPLDADRDVGRALVETANGRLVIDAARYRGATLADDLLDRDFTLNAIAADAHGDLTQIIDPLDGERDAIARIMRRCNPDALAHDPIRTLRAVRLSVQLGAHIDKPTRQDIRAAAPRLADTSPERVRDEFMKVLALKDPARGLRVAEALGLLSMIVPEIEALRGMAQPPPHVFDGWEHTLAVVESLGAVLNLIEAGRTDATGAQFSYGMIVLSLDRFRSRLQAHLAQSWPDGRPQRALLILAALLHDSGKPSAETIAANGRPHFAHHEDASAQIAEERAQALRLSNGERTRLASIVQHHMRPLWLVDLSPLAIHRFWRVTGEAGVDVCLLALADYLGTFGVMLRQDDWIHYLERIRTLLGAYFDDYERLVQPPTLVDGNVLVKELALKPGPIIGELLDAIREAQVQGIVMTADDALKLAREYMGKRSGE